MDGEGRLTCREGDNKGGDDRPNRGGGALINSPHPFPFTLIGRRGEYDLWQLFATGDGAREREGGAETGGRGRGARREGSVGRRYAPMANLPQSFGRKSDGFALEVYEKEVLGLEYAVDRLEKRQMFLRSYTLTKHKQNLPDKVRASLAKIKAAVWTSRVAHRSNRSIKQSLLDRCHLSQRWNFNPAT
eukprot:Gb_36514 [translate_table: standard]